MNIVRGQQICGIEVLRLRDALRASYPGPVTPDHVADRLEVTISAAAELCRCLAGEGYLERHGSDPIQASYEFTAKGAALRNASAAKPVRRETADRHLAAFMDRVAAVNSDDSLSYVVARVVLFGSMLGDARTVSDVDLAVELRRRTVDGEAASRRDDERRELAATQGRTFKTFVDELVWPEREVMLLLKGRSPVISLTTTRDGILATTATRVLFEGTL